MFVSIVNVTLVTQKKPDQEWSNHTPFSSNL